MQITKKKLMNTKAK